MFNRSCRDYPAIPKIYPVDGIFGPSTEAAVKKFQEIFDLTPDGIVGNSTWYKMVFLYVGVLDLAELISQGQTYYPSGSGVQPFPSVLQEGSRGEPVKVVQYLLSVVGEFYSAIPSVAIDGIYGPATKNAVVALQRLTGLPQDGIVGEDTWAALYRLYAGIVDTVDAYTNVIPEAFRPDLPEGRAAGPTQYPGRALTLGSADERGGAAS